MDRRSYLIGLFITSTGLYSGCATPTSERNDYPIYVQSKGICNPVLDTSDIQNRNDVSTVADPFWIVYNDKLHVFFEVLSNSGKEIAHATSTDGNSFDYNDIVLQNNQNDFSWPWIQRVNDGWFMIPTNDNDKDLEIYTTTENAFPQGWELAERNSVTDWYPDPIPIYIQNQNRWYIIFGDSDTVDTPDVELWYADQGQSLIGRSWIQHPESPIFSEGNSANVERGGGRPIIYDDGNILIFYQRVGDYTLIARRVTELTPTTFIDEPVIEFEPPSRTQWNTEDIHHTDILTRHYDDRSLAITDGKNSSGEFQLGVYRIEWSD